MKFWKIWNKSTQEFWGRGRKGGWSGKGKTYSRRSAALNAIRYHRLKGVWLIEYEACVSNTEEF